MDESVIVDLVSSSSSVPSASSSAVSVTVRETPMGELLELVAQIWRFNISTVDGSDITIGKVIQAILLIVLGLYSSRWVSRMLVRGILNKTTVHEGAALAFESISFYVLVSAFTLGALALVHIPLTVFTLVGGALAIGLGFGSQTLASNFISGVILLFEQPVRVGDIVEVDGVLGNVVRIGLRSTMVRTPANLDVVVPNNSLLDRKIVNWTLSDSNVRRVITMSIAYASDVKEVEGLILKIAASTPEILQYPTPGFFVVNFGASALECELRFWMSGRSIAECLRVESGLRVTILQELTKHGITIPFPQMEVRKVGS